MPAEGYGAQIKRDTPFVYNYTTLISPYSIIITELMTGVLHIYMGERACAENCFTLSKQVTERNTSQSFYDLYARSFHTIAHKLYGYYNYRANNLILHNYSMYNVRKI